MFIALTTIVNLMMAIKKMSDYVDELRWRNEIRIDSDDNPSDNNCYFDDDMIMMTW